MSLALLEEHRLEYDSDVLRGWRTERYVKRNVASHQRRGAVLVAESGGRTVGFVLLSRARFLLATSQPAGSITDIYVEPEWRRRGIGTRLLSDGVAWLGARGYKRVLLNVAAGNPARRLYERAGFRQFSESLAVDLK